MCVYLVYGKEFKKKCSKNGHASGRHVTPHCEIVLEYHHNIWFIYSCCVMS